MVGPTEWDPARLHRSRSRVSHWYSNLVIQRPLLLMEEIRRSPVEVASLSHCLQDSIHPRWLFGISSINSSLHVENCQIAMLLAAFFEKMYLCHTWIAIDIVYKLMCSLWYMLLDRTWIFFSSNVLLYIVNEMSKCFRKGYLQIITEPSSTNEQQSIQCIQRVQKYVFYQMIWFKQMKLYTMTPHCLLVYHYLGANLLSEISIFGQSNSRPSADYELWPRNRFLPETLGRGQAFATMDTFTKFGKRQTHRIHVWYIYLHLS